jgi:hypothetical protein
VGQFVPGDVGLAATDADQNEEGPEE